MTRPGELTPEEALAIVPQICEALQFAHDEGVVHRDIKPENILVDKKGRVKIADFGLAKLAVRLPGQFTLTGTHEVMGTPRYIAPEQMEGSHAVDHRADIYSLGVVFYEMLTGEIPSGHFEPPSKKVEIDVRLDEVVLRAMAREPERRYQHASEIQSDVQTISSRPLAVALTPGAPESSSSGFEAPQCAENRSRRVRTIVLLIAVMYLFFAGAFARYIGYTPAYFGISNSLTNAVLAIAFLGMLVHVVMHPGTLTALRSAFALLIGLVAVLAVVVVDPQPVLSGLYRLTGGTPGEGDLTMLRLTLGAVIGWIFSMIVKTRRKMALLERSE